MRPEEMQAAAYVLQWAGIVDFNAMGWPFLVLGGVAFLYLLLKK